MRIELLNTFLEVSRTLHFRVTAENLFVTPSAVSARIKLLEEDLGVFLFDRSQKQLKMTPQGNRFIKPASELVFMWQKVKQEISLVDDKKSVLAIDSMMSIWEIELQEWLNKISKNMVFSTLSCCYKSNRILCFWKFYLFNHAHKRWDNPVLCRTNNYNNLYNSILLYICHF